MNFIVDRHFQKNTDDYKKAYHFVVSTVGVIIMCIIFSYLTQYSKIYNQVSFMPVIIVNTAILFILYFTGSLDLAVNVICGGTLLALMKPILQTGGVSSQFFMWVMMAPLCGLTLGNTKKGAIWFIITIFYQITIYLLDQSSYNEYYKEVDKFTVLLNFVFYNAIIMTTLLSLERIKKHKNEIIQKQLDDIVSQSDVLTQKNIELERFAFIASHDLRTPLRNIISFSGLLSKKLKNIADSDVQQYMTFIKDYAYHMTHIVDDILEFAKIGKTEYNNIQPVDLEEVKSIVLTSLKEIIKVRNIVVNTEGVLPEVSGDKTHLVQLMQNLVENAITYNDNPKPEITIGIRDEGSTGRYIYVKDNGIGIDAQYQEKVFEMFTRLHNIEKYPGTGLGLAICKKIVMQYGGRIWLDSILNKGTTVKFVLPMAA